MRFLFSVFPWLLYFLLSAFVIIHGSEAAHVFGRQGRDLGKYGIIAEGLRRTEWVYEWSLYPFYWIFGQLEVLCRSQEPLSFHSKATLVMRVNEWVGHTPGEDYPHEDFLRPTVILLSTCLRSYNCLDNHSNSQRYAIYQDQADCCAKGHKNSCSLSLL